MEKFPHTQKLLLGDRIQTTALDVLEALIDATYTRDRYGHLARANLGIEKLRFLFRLAAALKCLDIKRYTHAARPTATGTRPTTGTTISASVSPARSMDGGGVMPLASGLARIAETTISASAQTSVAAHDETLGSPGKAASALARNKVADAAFSG